MGSKGSTVSTQSNQTTQPDKRVQQAGYQALSGAQSAAQLPFQMPQAPVAPFNNMQNQYFNQLGELQGMAQPYFDQASQYMQGSAAPITGQDVSQYYNPMAQNVFANLQDVFGQQMHQATGNAVQQAGGTGADRIGVAQANLAKQQGLAAGQTAASLYQPALQAAQQQKQMMAGAGFGLGQLGPAAQGAFLQGTGALGQGGAQQQALQQQQLNAQYQQQLAQIAYPFQTPQYLAGIVGGLGPTMGGTTSGQSQTTYPQPSPFAQIAGVGTAALGAYMGMPGAGMKGAYSGPTGNYMGYTPQYGSSIYGPGFRRGGGVFASGGAAYGDLAAQRFANSPVGNPYASHDSASDDDKDYASGGDVPPPLPGSAPPPLDTTSIVPKVPFTGSGSHFPTIDLKHQPLKQASSPGTDVADAITKTSKLLSARGGAVDPFDHFQPMQDGGDPDLLQGIDAPMGDTSVQPRWTMGDLARKAGEYWPTKAAEAAEATKPDPNSPLNVQKYIRPQSSPFTNVDVPYETAGGQQAGAPAINAPMPRERPMGAPGLPGSTIERAGPVTREQESSGDYQNVTTTRGRNGRPQSALGAYGIMEENLAPWSKEVFGEPVSKHEFLYGPNAKNIQDAIYRNKMGNYIKNYGVEGAGRAWLGGEGAVDDPYRRDALGTSTGDYGRRFADKVEGETTEMSGKPRGPSNPFITGNRDMTIDSMMRNPNRPYPDSTQRDWGQKLTRSPWMSLVDAGAKMAQTTGPIGSVIGAGIGAGSKSLQGQRQELQNEEQMNQKADALFQHAKEHLDKYQRMTPYEEKISEWRETKAQTGTALQKNANWMVANGIAPDIETAYKMASSGINQPAVYARMIAAEKANLAKTPEGTGKSEQELEDLARQRVQERFGLAPGRPTDKPPAVGEKRAFKDRAGNDVTGVWDGTEWKPA